jgi:hypothetical protein
MAQKPRTLFEAATARGRVIKQGEIACMVMDGGGAVIVFMQEFIGAQKWAQSRVPTANLLSDRARFLDQFSALISRPGSVQATRGNDRQLEKLARAMLGAGYDLAEWTLPVEFKAIGRGPAPQADPKATKDASNEVAAPPDSDPGKGPPAAG